MASSSSISTVAIIPILIILIAITNTVIVSAVRESELNVLFGVLRARGYHLFANAIATSDVHYDIKSNRNFTLFAPINSALFALDMTMPASNYVATLRYHIVPQRLSISDLLSLPPGSNSIPTLVPRQNVLVEQRRSPRSLITVGGVDIVVPGMFYGRDIAVHGLDGIFELRSYTRNPPTNLAGTSFSNISGNLTLEAPITDLPNNQTLPPPSPLVSTLIRNNTVQLPMAVQPSPSSNVTQNQTVTDPVAAPMAGGTAMHLAPRPNNPPTYPASFALTVKEHVSRAKLLELTAGRNYDLSPATERTSNRLKQFTPVDDKTVECSLADNGNADIHARKLYLASTMICAQR